MSSESGENMRLIADYTLGLAIVLTHLVWLAIEGDRHEQLEARQ
jgi:hypothetical protein